MNVVACQLDMVWEDQRANLAKVEDWLGGDPPAPGSLVVLPEMFATGFSMNVAGVAEAEPSATESVLAAWAKQWKIAIAAGLVRLDPSGRGLNQAVVFNAQGCCLARYTKIHPFALGGEDEHYRAGSEVVLCDLNGWIVAPFICYDLRFPELFRMASAQGAEAFLVLANWPAKRIEHWMTLLRARAIENQAYVVGVNRCGNDPHLQYNGQSLMIDPNGMILAQGDDQETLVRATWDRPLLESIRNGLPFLRDRRPSYHDLSVRRSLPAPNC